VAFSHAPVFIARMSVMPAMRKKIPRARFLAKLFAAALLAAAPYCLASFYVMTPETKAKAEKWEAGINARYDTRALTAFLTKIIGERKQFEDIDLTKAKVGKGWRYCYVEGQVMTSGDWVLVFDGGKDNFKLNYTLPNGPTAAVALECHRLEKDKFELLKIRRDRPYLFLQ
jgi:hypothetical protein